MEHGKDQSRRHEPDQGLHEGSHERFFGETRERGDRQDVGRRPPRDHAPLPPFEVGERRLWGVGIDADISTASLKAVVSAVNRAVRLDARDRAGELAGV